MPFESSGLFKRLANALYCIFKQGDINHITGDIHYVATFLKKKKTILTILDCGSLYQKKGFKYYVLKLIWFTILNTFQIYYTKKWTLTSKKIY